MKKVFRQAHSLVFYYGSVKTALLVNLLICFYISRGQGIEATQSIDQLNSIVSPSPTASSVGKYADWPVSLYTGVPNISIPLYEVKGRSIKVPITLNYHASGIKVSEIASWVGTGFSIDAGGIISRSVIGLPDDNGGYLNQRLNYINPLDMSSPNVEYPAMTDSVFQYNAARGFVDPQPDYYVLNALGRSYKLIFGSNGSVVTVPESNVKISVSFINSSGSYADGDLMEWVVILEDGTKLIFGSAESYVERITNKEFGNPSNGISDAILSWYLYKIISTTGETISFTYVNDSNNGIEESPSYSQTDYVVTTAGEPIQTAQASLFRGKVSAKLLSSIASDLDSVSFSLTSTSRKDLAGGHALSQISIYSKLNKQCIKNFKYQYSYTGALFSNTFYSDSTTNWRLHLNSLRETSPDSSIVKTWLFQYNPASLPSRCSYAQDHWGYFNGAISNSTLLPLEEPYFTTSYGIRDPDSVAVMAEMLTKITYPTGGYSVFNYQANSVATQQAQFTKTTSYVTPSTPTLSFQIQGTAQMVTIEITGSFVNVDVGGSTALASVRILDQYGNPLSGGTINVYPSSLNSSNDADITLPVILYNAGNYSLQLTIPDNSMIGSLSGDITYNQYTGTAVSPLLVGGVRIGSIFDYDNQTSQVIKRYFQYDDPFVIHSMSPADYLTTTTTRSYYCNLDGDPTTYQGLYYFQYTYYTRYSNVKSSLGSIQGGTIGYGKVTTLQGPNGVNGKTVSYFSNYADNNTDLASVFPYIPVTDRSCRRGLLQQQSEYTSAGALLKKETNTYNFVNPITLTAFKTAFLFSSSGCLYFTQLLDLLVREYYTVMSEQVNLQSSREVTYNTNANNTTDSLVVTKDFYYDDAANTQPVRTVTRDSRGDSLTFYSRTALEMPASALIDSMISKNMVRQVLQKQEYNNSNIVSRQTTTYSLVTGNNSYHMALPQSVQVQNGSGAPYTSVTVNNYDAYGNVIQFTPVDGVNKNYIWDYHSTRPIAEVTNASLTNIAYTSFEADGTGYWTPNTKSYSSTIAFTGNASFLLTGNNLYFTGLKTSGSYTVSLWAKSGATVSVNGGALSGGDTRNGWVYYETTVTNTTSVSITGSGNIDDARLYPVGAMMTTYAYGPYGITSSTDASNVSTFYQYDGLGRLVTVTDDQGKILKTYRYHYQ